MCFKVRFGRFGGLVMIVNYQQTPKTTTSNKKTHTENNKNICLKKANVYYYVPIEILLQILREQFDDVIVDVSLFKVNLNREFIRHF